MKKVYVLMLSTLIMGLLFGGCSKKAEPTDMDTIRSAPCAKLETADGQTVYVDSEIGTLSSLADMEIHAAPMEAADELDDWIYRITFNPSEKVSGSEEIVVSFHETYVQINSEYYLANEGVEFASILDWAESKFDYFFDEDTNLMR